MSRRKTTGPTRHYPSRWDGLCEQITQGSSKLDVNVLDADGECLTPEKLEAFFAAALPPQPVYSPPVVPPELYAWNLYLLDRARFGRRAPLKRRIRSRRSIMARYGPRDDDFLSRQIAVDLAVSDIEHVARDPESGDV